jgi:uncharacterized protein (DUF885 family)
MEERDKDYCYWPKSYKHDQRLNYLDMTLYITIVAFEQEEKEYDIAALMKDIKSNPDGDEQIFQQYLNKTGKSADDVSDREFRKLPTAPLTVQEVEGSLAKLETLGYIKTI